jgi:CRISPR/Cas system CMR-associated protein Cmr1 (group 7 of RAMP superfamily)
VEYLAFNLRNHQDARSVYPAGTKFSATLLNRSLTESDWKRLLDVSRIYFQLGSLGARSRRGFGAIEMLTENGETSSAPTMESPNGGILSIRAVDAVQPANDPTAFLIKAGNWLRDKRQALGRDKDELLGYVKGNRRKASPVLLRPVRTARGLKLVLIGEKSKVERILS